MGLINTEYQDNGLQGKYRVVNPCILEYVTLVIINIHLLALIR